MVQAKTKVQRQMREQLVPELWVAELMIEL